MLKVKNVCWKIKNFAPIFAFIFLFASSAFSANYTTYQAKIVKPDGYPLEANNVNFKFTILSPAGNCILYSETYSAVNMANTGGVISFSLGSGVKTYPVSSPTFFDIFNNGVASHSCDSGGPVTYVPAANDTRKIVMQFHDGSGWQTLPAMSINAVPYAMYANDSQSLGGVSATSYVRYSTIPTCTASEALHYNGAGFNCVALPNTGNFTAGDVAAALSYTPANAASLTSINSTISSVSSTVNSVSSSVYAVSSTVNSLASNFSSFQNSVAVSLAAITSSQWTTSGSAIFYNTGNVGVGTANPATKLDVAGGLRISMEVSACAANLAGTLRYNAGAVEYCNGVTWAAFGVSGAGLQGLNGSTSGTQSFAIGTTGTAPAFNTNNGVHTLNIPLASAGSVTAGLLSNADYSTFMNKITSSAAAIAQVLGYAPVSSTTLGNYVLRANNLSDLTSSATARANLGLGTLATASSIDLGSASATGTLAAARLPSFAGDMTSVSGSNSLTLANSGVTSGTYTKVTVDTKGRVISGAQLTSSDVTTALGFTPGAATSGVTSLNGSTSQTQTFANGTAGTAPTFVTANGVHTLNIPLASAGSVTGGLLSNADYTTFMGKITSSAASIAQVLGYTPASATQLSNFLVKANNLSDLASSATARTNLGVGYIGTLTSVDLGSADVSGTLAIARTPAYAGDVTKAAASNTLILSNSGVTAGTYTKVTVDAKGRVTSSSSLTNSDVVTALGFTPGAATSGVTSLNGSTSQTQTFAIGTTGTAPAFNTAAGVHTLNIPLASAGAVTGGLLSNADYTTFMGKITSSAASIAQVLGYTPANSATVSALETLVNSQWQSSGTSIYYNSGYVGIGISSATAKLEIAGVSSGWTSNNWKKAIKLEPTSSLQFTKGVSQHFGVGASGSGGDKFYIWDTLADDNSSPANYRFTIVGSSGNIGIGTVTPTAALHIKAGTSSTAALKLTSGTLLTSPQAGSFEFDGVGYYITDGNNVRRAIATGSASGSIDNAGSITNASGNIVMTPNSSVVISSTTQSTSSSTGALVVNGGIGVSGNIYSSGTIVTSSNIQGASITATYGMITPYIAGSTVSGGTLTLDSTTNAGKGKILMATNGGNVGIGIANPDEQLHLSKVLKFTNTIGVNQFRAPTADSFRIFAQDDAGTGNPYGTGDNNAKIFENVDGNNTTPDDGFFFVNHGTSGPVIAMSILGNGYVGIGTSAPSAALEIGKNSASGSSIRFAPSTIDQGSIRFTTNSSANWIQSGLDYTSDSKKDLKFSSINGVTTWMTIQASTGNVGIGSTNPTDGKLVISASPVSPTAGTQGDAKLAFNSTVFAYGSGPRYINLYPSTTVDGHGLGISNGMTELYTNSNFGFFVRPNRADINGTYTSTEVVRISGSNGRVGIGTSAPAQALDVNGGIKSIYGEPTGSNANASGFSFDGDTGMFAAGDGMLNFWSNNQRTMSLYNGKVGIGTSSPTQALDVSGTAKASFFSGDGSLLTNISAANLTFYNYPSGYASGAVPFSSFSQGVTGWQDYTGTALGVSSTYWAGITTRNGNTGAQFAVNWDNNGNTPSGFRIRSQDDNYGSWGQWRSVAFIDATVKLSGDTMTGTLNLPSNGLAVGTDQLVVSGTNVGIGTVIPDVALNVVGTGGADDDVHIDSYSNSQEGTVMLRRARGTAAAPTALLAGDRIGFYTFRGYDGTQFSDLSRIQATVESDLSASGSSNLAFFTTYQGINNEKMRMSASGTLGIGTTTPTTGYKLDVNGDIYMGNGGATQTLRFRTANTDGAFIRFNSTADSAGNSYLELGTTDNNDEPIIFTQSGNERMRIHTNGGVGIGTSAPTTKLDVRGNAVFGTSAKVQIEDQTTFTRLAFNELRFWDWDTGGDAMTISGNFVGIGTTAPDDRLVVYNGSTTGRYTTGGWTHSSDARLKHDVKPLENSLQKITQLRGVAYTYNNDPTNTRQVGFIAQEVEPFFPQVVQTDKKGFKSMIYANLVAPVVEAIKELFQRLLGVEATIKQQSQEIEMLKAKSSSLEEQNKALKDYLCEKDPNAKICK